MIIIFNRQSPLLAQLFLSHQTIQRYFLIAVISLFWVGVAKAASTPLLSGPDTTVAGRSTSYSFLPEAGSASSQWRQALMSPYTLVEGAENGLANVTPQVPAGYALISNSVSADSGFHSFHFTNWRALDQTMTLGSVAVPTAGGQLQFMSWFRYAGGGQSAHVQVSADNGVSWSDRYVQTGDGTRGEPAFSLKTISLDQFAGMTIRIRFLFTYNPLGDVFTFTYDDYGWFVDQISVSSGSAILLNEGAENGLGNVSVQVPAGYSIISNTVYTDPPPHSFHLTNWRAVDESFALNDTVVPTTGSQLQFMSWFRYAGGGQSAHVQISTDEGRNWTDRFVQTGDGTTGEAGFSMRSVSLAPYAGQSIKVRFAFQYDPAGDLFSFSGDAYGWFLDQIAITNAQRISSTVVTDISTGSSFAFTPNQPGNYALQARPIDSNLQPGEWGPVKAVVVGNSTGNGAPTITQIPASSVNEDGSTSPISFTVGDAETAASSLTVTASSSNTRLVPTASIALAGGGASRTVVVTPAPNQSGSATITLTVSDGSLTASANFLLTVNPVNDAPVGADKAVTLMEDGTYTFTVADFGFSDPNDTPANSLLAVKLNTTPAVGTLANNGVAVSAGAFVSAADIAAGKLKFNSAPGRSGSPYASFIFQVQDDGGTANGGINLDPISHTISLYVTSVNDAPSFTKGGNQEILNNSSTQTIPGWATSISAGPSDEAGQALDFIVTNDHNAFFSVQPMIAANGTLTYTPKLGSSGSAVVTVRLHDNGGTANGGNDTSAPQTFTINFTAPVSEKPQISSEVIANGTKDQPFNYQIVASNNPTFYAATSLPDGLNINQTTGLISGTPATNGVSTITLSATNAGGTGTAILTLTVTPPAPQISSPLTATAMKGQSFTYQIVGSDTPMSYGASGLPSGLSINPNTGVISGTPSVSGVSTVTMTATNAGGTGSATLNLTVNPPAPQITSALTTNATKDQFFSYQIVGSNAPTSYNATGLPAGLEVNTGTGLISGTPSVTGASTVTLSASNITGTGTATLTLTVTRNPQPPVISATAFPIGTVGQAFSYQIAASNSPASYGAAGLPTGLEIDANTGLIAGTPASAGESAVTLSATNAVGTNSKTLTLKVIPPTPAITSNLTVSGQKNQSFNYQIVASNNPTSYGALGLPAGLNVDGATGLISGTPSIAGTFNVTLSAGNAGGTGTSVLRLTVEDTSTSGTLTVAIVPANGGSVTPGFSGSTNRIIGTTYSIKATPAPGFIFTGWSGSWSGSEPTFAFAMAQGFNLQANFAPDPLLAARGEYNGLAGANVPVNGTSGSVKIVVGLGGRFTGRLILAGVAYPFTGSFNQSGMAAFGVVKRATLILPRVSLTPLELALQLDVSANSSHRITGTLSEAGVVVSSINADEALFTDAKTPVAPRRNLPSQLAGGYTFLFPASVQNTVPAPQGNGFGRIVVGSNGSVRYAGTLADGFVVAGSTYMAQDGSFPMYVPLYRNGGAIFGQVSVVSQGGNDVSGELVWFRPALPSRALYPAGWIDGITLNLRGSHYLPASGAAGNGMPPTPVTVILSSGNLTSSLTIPGSLYNTSVTLQSPLSLRGFTFSINPANGVFFGKFIHPVSKLPEVFKGVLLQNQKEAGGFFLGTTESGAIAVEQQSTN